MSILATATISSSCLGTEGSTSPATNPRDTELMTLAKSEEARTAGKEAYGLYCLACHGAEGLDADSPSNLFDAKWHLGGEPSGIEKTIREGYMEKGMPAWGQMISDQEIESIIAYLLSFQAAIQTTND